MSSPVDLRPWPSFWDVAYAHGDHLAYWDPPATPPELRALLDSGRVADDATVLDLGCGAGRETIACADAGHLALGVDRSLPALVRARRRARAADRRIAWCRADVFALPIAASSVDLVLDRGMMHVIPRRRRLRYARELTRVLGPGGLLLLRGAARDDEDAGLVVVDQRAVDRLFPAERFRRISAESVVMASSAEELAASSFLLEHRPSPQSSPLRGEGARVTVSRGAEPSPPDG